MTFQYGDKKIMLLYGQSSQLVYIYHNCAQLLL